MTSKLRWFSFFLGTLLFGVSPYIFLLFNSYVIEGDSNNNYYVFYILLTAPVALIILIIGWIRFLISRQNK